MKRENRNEKTSDLEKCKEKILSLLAEYNCVIETEDYSGLWMRDRDTDETVGMRSS